MHICVYKYELMYLCVYQRPLLLRLLKLPWNRFLLDKYICVGIHAYVCVCVCVYVKSWASHMTSRQISSTSPLRRSLACIVWFISHLKWVVSPHGWVMSHYKWVTSRHERVTWHLDRFQQRRRYGDRLSSRNGRRATNKPSSLKERTVSRLPKSGVAWHTTGIRYFMYE